MKKSFHLYIAPIVTSILLLSACVSNNLKEGEELVEYKNFDYKVERKNQLTKEEIRQDCDMLKYIIYTCYAGIDELKDMGVNLDEVVETIYEQTMNKKQIPSNLYARSDFVTIMRQNLAKAFKNDDQHFGVDGILKDATSLYYSNVYFEKKEDGSYTVKKSEEEAVNIGQVFTGPQMNLFEMFCDGEIVYRYGVITKLKVKTVNLSVDDTIIPVSVKKEDTLYQKTAWNGLKSTNETLYMSLSDCFNINGLETSNQFTEELFEKYLQKVCVEAASKKNIIFDLRSNTGGYVEFPAKMLAAAFYNQHPELEFRKEIEAFMLNSVFTDCKMIISPLLMQRKQKIYKGTYKQLYARHSDETKAYFKQYWKKMQYTPIRTFIDARIYACNITEFPEPDFKGTIYLLLNRNSASASELGTEIAFLFQSMGIDVKIIGENSAGAIKYVSLFGYQLPNSSVYLSVPSVIGVAPHTKLNPRFMGEGKGFYPDYWATSENLLETIVECTKDKELETVLAQISKEML